MCHHILGRPDKSKKVSLKLDCDEMVQELVACIQLCVDEVAEMKVVTTYSRPWIDHKIAQQFKKLRKAQGGSVGCTNL